MSTIKVTNLQHASAASAAIVLASDSTATLNGLAYPTSGSLSGRNRIINGDMRIDQRNAGASVTPSAGLFTYTVDRWAVHVSQSSKCTIQQNAGSVTPPAGFANYLGATSSSAYSIISTDLFLFDQPIEGFNAADLSWGTANAKTVTLSFWVRSSLTGTFGGALLNSAANRSYPFSYSISAANTWTQISVTIAGDTTGTWLTTNGIGIVVSFGFGVGSTYSGTAGSWAAGQYWSATGATSVVGTNGATFYITGVQLEAGSVATPFERRSYGQELMLCQRYAVVFGRDQTFNQIGGSGFAYSATNCDAPVSLPVQMRSTPTATTSGSFQLSDGVSALTIATISLIGQQSSTLIASLQAARASGLTAAKPYRIETANSTTAYVLFSAEL